MSFISIHDPTTNAFYNQTTSGATPESRYGFCPVGIPGSNGTYEIFIYGGLDDAYDGDDDQQTQLSDAVYVLSLPGFVWHKVNIPAVHSRILHSCNIIGNSQMVVIGGMDANHPAKTSFKFRNSSPTRDPWLNGINLFDMNTLRWTDYYDPNATEYKTPKVIADWYGGNGRWSFGGFENATVASLFGGKPASATNTVTASKSPLPKIQSSHYSHTGAIAGGVVGGVVGVALILAGTVLLARQPRRRQGQDGQTQFAKPELDSTMTGSPNTSYQHTRYVGGRCELATEPDVADKRAYQDAEALAAEAHAANERPRAQEIASDYITPELHGDSGGRIHYGVTS